MPRTLTLVAVGDNASKKTELLIEFVGGNQFYKDATQPRFTDTVDDMIVDSKRYKVHFVDTECDDDYKIVRRNAIEDADSILLCYSISNRESFKNLTNWCIEIREYAPFVPIILVGTEAEARNNSNLDCVSADEGDRFKCLIGAFAFVECSIEKFVGVEDVFIEAIRGTRYKLQFQRS